MTGEPISHHDEDPAPPAGEITLAELPHPDWRFDEARAIRRARLTDDQIADFESEGEKAQFSRPSRPFK